MIITETITIRDKEYLHNYSDEGYYIIRDGIKYADAIDAIDSDRVYEETDELIEQPEEESEEKIIEEEVAK